MTKMPYGIDLKEYTEAEYEADMKAKLKELGLYKAVEEILDEMVGENRGFSYAHFSLMAECACDILTLIEMADKAESEDNT